MIPTTDNADEWVAHITEIRDQGVARDWGLTIEEARSEHEDPASFVPTARAVVEEASGNPNWWDRRQEETPEQHGQRLKRLHFCLAVVSGRHGDYGRAAFARAQAVALPDGLHWARATGVT
jgi:hypothetical protein